MKPTPHGSRRTTPLIFSFLLLLLFVAPPGASPSSAQKTSPSNSSEVLKFTVAVGDGKGGFVSGLTKDAFKVFEGKTEREIIYFNDEEAPASVGILIDVSGAPKPEEVRAAKLTIARFIQRSRPDNEYFISEFNREWRELADWTRDEGAIIEGLRKIAETKPQEEETKKRIPYWRTALYDACFAALGKLASGAHPKRVLFIITDGWEDNASTRKRRELENLIKTSDVLIYAVCLPTPSPDPPSWLQDSLYELIAPSGGWVSFTENAKEVNEVIDMMALELRRQYVIGFSPANSAPGGKWNKVKIKVTPPTKQLKNLFVRSREGYFSPVATPAP